MNIGAVIGLAATFAAINEADTSNSAMTTIILQHNRRSESLRANEIEITVMLILMILT